MVCPSCNTYLPEEDLIKTNVKMYGGTAVDYDARCPLCSNAIGHMFWGEFIPLPHLRSKWKPLIRAQSPQSAAGEAEPEEPEQPTVLLPPEPSPPDLLEEEPFLEEVSLGGLPAGPAKFYCPHCGKTLPDVLPVERRHIPREEE